MHSSASAKQEKECLYNKVSNIAGLQISLTVYETLPNNSISVSCPASAWFLELYFRDSTIREETYLLQHKYLCLTVQRGLRARLGSALVMQWLGCSIAGELCQQSGVVS